MIDVTISGVSLADHLRDLTDMQDDLDRRLNELTTRVAVLEPATPPVIIPPIVIDEPDPVLPVPDDDLDPPYVPPTSGLPMPRRHLLMAGDNWPKYPFPNFQFVSALYPNNLFTPNTGRVASQVQAHGKGAPWGLKLMFPTFGNGFGIEVTRAGHPEHKRWASRIADLGWGIKEAQDRGDIPKGFALTVNHEFFGGWYAKNWSIADGKNPKGALYEGHDRQLLADNIKETADILYDQGADVRIVLSPNTLRNEDQTEQLVWLRDQMTHPVGLGLSWYVMDGSKHPLEAKSNNAYQSLENQLGLLSTIDAQAPLYINETGFNPTEFHFDKNGDRQVTNAPDRLEVIDDFFDVVSRFPNLVGIWYFNRNKVLKEDFRLVDDGTRNPSVYPSETARFMERANRWLNNVA